MCRGHVQDEGATALEWHGCHVTAGALAIALVRMCASLACTVRTLPSYLGRVKMSLQTGVCGFQCPAMPVLLCAGHVALWQAC